MGQVWFINMFNIHVVEEYERIFIYSLVFFYNCSAYYIGTIILYIERKYLENKIYLFDG